MPVAASYRHGRAKHDRAMNSSVGVGAIIGLHSSKILGFDSRANNAVSGSQQLAMELCSRARLSPELVRVLQGYGARFCSERGKIFTAVGYQTRSSCCWSRPATIKRLSEEIDVGIEKWADQSHAIKNFGSRLDEAKTTHPELKNYMVLAHITNCHFFTPSSQKNMSPGTSLDP